MAKWKICRQTYGDETYEFTEGDTITIGRGMQNNIILSSLNISRKHCVITVKRDEVLIEDLKSANGIFVGLKKITPNIPFSLSDNDIIGLGWTDGAPLAKVNDSEKFVFKLTKTTKDIPIKDRIQYQNENEPHEITDGSMNLPLPKVNNLSLKRKSNIETQSHNKGSKNDPNIKKKSDNCDESSSHLGVKKIKYNFDFEDAKEEPIIKIENEDEQYEAFNIKQEFIDDEVQVVDSDSDSEQWYIRLSQNSPRKSFPSLNESKKSEDCCPQDSSYSQLDDDVIFVKNEAENKNDLDEEDYQDDLFTIIPQTGLGDIISKISEVTNDKNNLMPELANACIEITDEGIEIDNSHPTSKALLVQDNEDYNKITDVVKEVDKHIEDDNMPKLTNNPNDSVERSIQVNEKESFDPSPSDKSIEKNDKLVAFNEAYQKIQETKRIIVREIDTKKSYVSRKIQLTDIISSPSKKHSHNFTGKVKKKDCNKSKSSLFKITNSQKEARKKKLRDIATKGKGEGEHLGDSNLKNDELSTTTSKISAKVTTSNRGAFLIDAKPIISKPTKKKKGVHDTKVNKKDEPTEPDDIIAAKSLSNDETTDRAVLTDRGKEERNNTKKKSSDSTGTSCKHRTLSADSVPPTSVDSADTTMIRRHSVNISKENDSKKQSPSTNKDKNKKLLSKTENENSSSNIVQLKQKKRTSLDKSNLTEKNECIDDNNSASNKKETSAEIKLQYKVSELLPKNKPVLKPLIKSALKSMEENREPNRKSKKCVKFYDIPEVREFEIEPGNQMKKTSMVKSTLLARHHSMPVLSLQKIALVKILRWNPQWLEEQRHFTEPAPILGHNNIPMAIPHSFTSHTQYVDLIGDLLLMEIWECLTQGYDKTRDENTWLPMGVDSLPLVPPQRHGLELINILVNVAVPTPQAHVIPREGEMMMIQFGEERQICRFFFVNNVRFLPSHTKNINAYSISLQTSFTEKMRTLQRGSIMYARRLAYINKDLRLFEAMEYLLRSPLKEVILNPKPGHFILDEADRSCNMESQWSQPLNESQREAVRCAVSAARGERPRIHMIQGPPGTGKSRVICAIVMEYFYDAAGRKQKNRGKILLCATSNAAVDELVIRLLDIRQSLPQPERLNMVRVGRAEAMHPRAYDISSLKLAQRGVARAQPEPALQPSALNAEISLLEAKKNMWQTKAMSTNDDARKAYCENRVAEITRKIAMFRSGGGGGGGAGCPPEQLAAAERRVLEGADVVLTTLASAHSHKMRSLAGRIALCVVDEAGQAVEPETLVPLTLGVSRLALVGDPQQLPGFICSQRAKQHGLGESLFARLSSCSEAWGAGGPVLLDRQYRMHPHIADYPNRAFYGGRVRDETSPARALDAAPYFVLGIASGDSGQDASGANDAEAWGAARVALALRSRLRAAAAALPAAAPALPAAAPAPTAAPPAQSAALSLAVITPYAAQRDLVRRHLRTLLQAEGGAEAGEVEVNTVDSFQGQERSVVVVSLARSHGPGFLAAAGRMNVLLTRAKHALVLCLNPRALENHNQWRSLVEDAQKRNLFGTLPLHMCRPPSVQQVSNQEILQCLGKNPPVNNTWNQPYPHKRRPNKKNRRRHDRGRN